MARTARRNLHLARVPHALQAAWLEPWHPALNSALPPQNTLLQ